jgi:hypothetical protein
VNHPSTNFLIAYALLCAVVALLTLFLFRVVRETLGLLRVLDGPKDGLPGGTPRFTARLAGTRKRMSSSALRGRKSILFFVKPEDRDRSLTLSARGLSQKVNGNLYVVCRGSDQHCGELLREFQPAGVPVILDEAGDIMRSFQVSTTPSAAQLDVFGNVVRFGIQVVEPVTSPQKGELT